MCFSDLRLRLLRFKGAAWLATRHYSQAHAALAGTQFSMTPGPGWCEEAEGTDAELCARATELVCIGQELDHAKAAAALDKFLLTKKEMAGGHASWAAMPDPFRHAWDREANGHAHGHAPMGD